MSSPLSAFTAVPNPQMLAFMGTQSFIMMYQAGEGWQYGKRKQSALSNEEFNKQTPLSIMDRQRQELINALPSIKDSMNAMTPLIQTIVEQYGDFLREVIDATPEALKKATSGNFPLPLAFGDTGQKDTNPTLSESVWKIAEALLNMRGGLITNTGNYPGKETEEERIRNDKLIKQQEEKRKQLSHQEIRERNKFGNVVPYEKTPVIGVGVKKQDSYVRAQYTNEIFRLMKFLKEFRMWRNKAGYIGSVPNTFLIPGVKSQQKKMDVMAKRIRNYITLARNNNALKSLANNDWNKRIWKI